MKKIFQLTLLLIITMVLFTGCDIKKSSSTNFKVTEINGIGKEYKTLVGSGEGCNGNLIDEQSDRCYNLCKVNDFKVTNIVKDNIGGTDYIFIYYDFISSLVAGEIGSPCYYTLDVYDVKGNKLNNESSSNLNVSYFEYNSSVSSSGTYKAPMSGEKYSITIKAY